MGVGRRKIKNLHIKGPSFSEVFLTFGGFPTGLVDLFDVEGLFHFYDLRVGFFFSLLLSFSLSIAFHSERFLITYKIAISSCTANSLERKKEREK